MLYNIKHVVKNKFSRPGIKLNNVLGIVVHWTANPGASDTAHQTFFDGSDGGGSRYAGAHIFIDKDSAVEIIPLNEIAYHANDHDCKVAVLLPNANFNTIGVEMCVEKDGTIHPDTVKRTVQVVAHLCNKFKLTSKRVYRHYDITGKNCPAPWVKDASLFQAFKTNVDEILSPKFYSVKKGDTLYSIAKQRKVSVDSIKKVNKLTSDVLSVGQKLKI